MPQRIVSLVPSQTELLYDLGLADRVVGITKFCIHPKQWRSEKTIVGGTKQYHFDRIRGLAPDLIIGNKEENEQEGIKALAAEYPVWMSDISDLSEALDMIQKVGLLVGRSEPAIQMVHDIEERFSNLRLSSKSISALYLIWKDPFMAAGSSTFIDHMMTLVGFENCLSQSRYPILSIEEIAELRPEVLLLSSEPYPFKEKHVMELKENLPDTRVLLADGELFSWYGSRLLQSPLYFEKLLSEVIVE
ncbi:helical backbone metal receptor [Roseivirga sp. E12]|uniref:helical backbone metal receptor n=1 Tax=Roseivirga sp. E12 TaxID=2819237 RepID=UPI001F48F64B|nr:helical backbone metal receptor [Roseivirga sp. E12]